MKVIQTDQTDLTWSPGKSFLPSKKSHPDLFNSPFARAAIGVKDTSMAKDEPTTGLAQR